MDARLTEGAILKITTEFVDDNYKPILQVIDLKQIHTQSGGGQVTERHGVVISDGSHTVQGILSTQQNFLVQQGHLQKGSVVCLNQFICTTIQGRKIIIIVLLDVLVDKCDIIGQATRFSNALSPRTRLVDQTTETIISEPYSLPAMDARLTEGAILNITTEYFDDNYKPILQVIDLKQIHTQSGGGQVTERYGVVISDGSHTAQGILSTQQNFLVQQGHLQKGSVVCLNQFICTTIQGRKIIIIVLLDVLVDKCDIIGQAARFSNALYPRTRLVDQTTETIISEPYSLPAMDARLTEGAILNITTEYFDDNYKPILQVIDLKQLHTHGGGQVTERYRVAISDGSHTEQGILATQQNFLVQQGHLQKGSVVRLNQFTCTTIQGRKIIIIISLNVLVDKCDIIGQAARFSNAQSQGTVLKDQTTEQFGSLGL